MEVKKTLDKRFAKFGIRPGSDALIETFNEEAATVKLAEWGDILGEVKHPRSDDSLGMVLHEALGTAGKGLALDFYSLGMEYLEDRRYSRNSAFFLVGLQAIPVHIGKWGMKTGGAYIYMFETYFGDTKSFALLQSGLYRLLGDFSDKVSTKYPEGWIKGPIFDPRLRRFNPDREI